MKCDLTDPGRVLVSILLFAPFAKSLIDHFGTKFTNWLKIFETSNVLLMVLILNLAAECSALLPICTIYQYVFGTSVIEKETIFTHTQ